MTTEIELYSKLQNPIEAIDRMGEWFAKSGMFGCEKVEQGKMLALACVSEGKSPLEIMRTYHLLEGRLSMKADAMLAKFRAAGGKHVILCRTAEKAAIKLIYDGQENEFAFTFEEAQKEPFVRSKDGKSFKKNWATPRARMQMLWARVISEGVHTVAPEIVNGISTPEEIGDGMGEDAPVKQLFPEGTTGPTIDVSVPPTPATIGKAKQNPPPTIPAEVIPPPAKSPADDPAQDDVSMLPANPTTVKPPASPADPPAAPTAAPDNGFPEAEEKDGKLTTQTVQSLVQAIGDDDLDAAMAFLTVKGKLPKDGTLDQLPIVLAKRILTRPADFIIAVHASQQPKPAAS